MIWLNDESLSGDGVKLFYVVGALHLISKNKYMFNKTKTTYFRNPAKTKQDLIKETTRQSLNKHRKTWSTLNDEETPIKFQ